MTKHKSIMSHTFSQIPKINIPRSSFDRSHSSMGAFDAGKLVPFYVDEALPGDTFNLKCSIFARLATPIFPIMTQMTLSTFFFAIPNRLVWDNWAKFCGEQLDPGDSIDFTIPVQTSNSTEGSLMDFMGINPNSSNVPYSNLPMRSYWLCWDQWFRDENLQESADPITTDAASVIANTGTYEWKALADRGKRHDYFTSSMTAPQKGASVDLPLGTTAPIIGIGSTGVYGGSTSSIRETGGPPTTTYTGQTLASNLVYIEEDPANTDYPAIYADLTNATAATINQLRQSFSIQKLLERDMRGGTRLIEIVKSHFGVDSPDLRATRPIFLGGGKARVNITPVAQTGETGTSPQGNLSAFGTVNAMGHGFTKSFTEHCTIIGLMCVDADLIYQQSLNRMWSRQTRYDFYWPSLAHIGEQAVLNQEIYADGSANDLLTWGYQERNAEYRYKPSVISGILRSSATASLEAWHLAEDFASAPVLNAAFITSKPPIDRCIAVPTEPHFIFDAWLDLRCARPMPLYGVPGFGDRF